LVPVKYYVGALQNIDKLAHGLLHLQRSMDQSIIDNAVDSWHHGRHV